MDILLPWQQKHALITLLFGGIRTSYLLHTFLEATAISGINCFYGYIVTMTTKASAYSIAFHNIFHIWCTHSFRQQQSLVLPIAMNTLLSWQQKQVLITLLFEGIQISYLVQMFLEVFVISFTFCCYEYNVTMATEAMYL